MSAALLEISELTKSFTGPGGADHPVICVGEFNLEDEAQVALWGESGSGKTTFLNLIAGILQPDSGTIRITGQEMSALAEPQRDRLRGRMVGYVFQTFNLLPAYTCLENVLLAMLFGAGEDRRFAEHLLQRVGLGDYLEHYPRELSTGQQQRVAVARALANQPRLVLADEPTGNLDSRNSRETLALIRDTCRESKAALLLVSHDREVLAQFETTRSFEGINRPSAPTRL